MSTTVERVPTNPRLLADHPDFPDLCVYRRLVDQVGKVDADFAWAQALVAAGLAHPSAVKS